jgi:hypothetical protein
MRKTQCTALLTAVLAMSRCEAQQYWSAKNPVAPLPRSPFPELAVYEVEKGVYVYDDSQVDYEKLFQESTAEEQAATRDAIKLALAQNGGAMAMAMGSYPDCVLWLAIEPSGSAAVKLTLHNTTAGKTS